MLGNADVYRVLLTASVLTLPFIVKVGMWFENFFSVFIFVYSLI